MNGLYSLAISSMEFFKKPFIIGMKTCLNSFLFFSKRWSFILILLICHFSLFASQKQEITDSISAKKQQVSRKTQIQTLADKELTQSVLNYEQHKKLLDQQNKFILLFTQIQNVESFLKEGFDYRKATLLIKNVTKWKEVAVEGVITNKNKIQNNRNLTATYILLNELINRVEVWEHKIYKYHVTLGLNQHKLDSLAKDSVLYQVIGDSASINDTYKKLLSMKARLDPMNDHIKQALDSIQQIENQVSLLKSNLKSDVAETELLRQQMESGIKFNELEIFNQAGYKHKTFGEVLVYSMEKAKILAMFYIANHLYKLFLMILTAVGLALYLRVLVRRSKTANIFDQIKKRTQVLNYPNATAILLTATIFQFFLPLPPFFITSFLWLICAISLTIILMDSLDRFWINAWLIFLVLFIISLFHNFILIETSLEHWAITFMSIVGIVLGFRFMFDKRRKESKQKIIIVLLMITTAY